MINYKRLAQRATLTSGLIPVIGLLLLVACASNGADGKESAEDDVYFGANVPIATSATGAGDTYSTNAFAGYETLLGENLDIALFFYSLGDVSTVSDDVGVALSAAITPFLKIEPWSWGGCSDTSFELSRFSSGTYDTEIAAWATQLKSLEKPMLVSFGHEMNVPSANCWYPWQGHPSAYIEATIYFFDKLTSLGVTNVTPVFNPNVNDLASAANYFPGTEYFKWGLVDGYNTTWDCCEIACQ